MSVITGLQIATTGFTDILNQFAEWGMFSYALPFLLIFAVTFGILGKIRIFGEPEKNKGLYAIIAVAVGLLSLQWDVVPTFFGSIFPYAGVGIGILLVVIILMGLFGLGAETTDKWKKNTFFIVGAGIAIVVVISALTSPNWTFGVLWERYGAAVITLAIILVLVAWAMGGKGEEPTKPRLPTAKTE